MLQWVDGIAVWIVARQTLVFFLFNIAFTGFNAWLSWRLWRREANSDYPTISATIDNLGPYAVLALRLTAAEAITWQGYRTVLVRPRRGRIAYPPDHMVQDETGAPWIPGSYDPDLNLLGLEARFPCRLVATSGSTGEMIFLHNLAPGDNIDLMIEMFSEEPYPRRYRDHIKRQVPPLKTVKAN